MEAEKGMDQIPAWFEGARLNWAENILAKGKPDQIALIQASKLPRPLLSGVAHELTFFVLCNSITFPVEPAPNSPLSYTRLTYSQLRTKVHHLTLALRHLGLQPGQILAYYGPTSSASVALLLATSAIGAIWSSAASDFGAPGVLERFAQFGDTLWGVVGAESVRYNGKVLPQRAKLEAVVDGLRGGRAKKLEVVVFDFLGGGLSEVREGWRTMDEVEQIGQEADEGKEGEVGIKFEQLPFDHPLWILFSSGTTGKPKPIVHRAGGMLLQSQKEHIIHGNMGPDSVFFQYTTPGWSKSAQVACVLKEMTNHVDVSRSDVQLPRHRPGHRRHRGPLRRLPAVAP